MMSSPLFLTVFLIICSGFLIYVRSYLFLICISYLPAVLFYIEHAKFTTPSIKYGWVIPYNIVALVFIGVMSLIFFLLNKNKGVREFSFKRTVTVFFVIVIIFIISLFATYVSSMGSY